MISRRPLFSCVCGIFAAVALFALPSASASAAGPKVLVLTRNEEGNGPPAKPGEPSQVVDSVTWPLLHVACGADDEAATLGKNPSATVKATGSDMSGGFCLQFPEFETLPGGIAVKSASVSKTGAVKLTGTLEVTVGECTYRATKLAGTQVFGEEQQWLDELTGTGKRVSPSAKSCAKTTPVEDQMSVSNAEGFNYVLELTS